MQVLKKSCSNVGDGKGQIVAEDVLSSFLEWYSTPSFGSMTKHDVDLQVFAVLKQIGVFPKNPDVYEVMRMLKVTRSKARNLIYESSLRKMENSELEDELKQILSKPILEKDGSKISLQIENPLLTDYIKTKLKECGHLSDGSFSPELIKMSVEAFADLFVKLFPNKEQHLNKELRKLKVKNTVSLKQILPGILRFAAKTVGGKVLEDVTDDIITYAKDWINDAIENVSSARHMPKEFFQDDTFTA